ncbi:hypothetical protein K2Y11_11420 [bacterium]|nr:hypothetical protein [bacterium]
MKNRHFRRWAGPLVGAVAVPILLLKVARRSDPSQPGLNDNLPAVLIGGAIAGLVIGGLVSLLDTAPSTKLQDADGVGGENAALKPAPLSGSLVSRLLAILSVVLAITGVVGLGFGVAGVISNWRSKGWPLVTSWVGLVLSVLIELMVLFG